MGAEFPAGGVDGGVSVYDILCIDDPAVLRKHCFFLPGGKTGHCFRGLAGVLGRYDLSVFIDRKRVSPLSYIHRYDLVIESCDVKVCSADPGEIPVCVMKGLSYGDSKPASHGIYIKVREEDVICLPPHLVPCGLKEIISRLLARGSCGKI